MPPKRNPLKLNKLQLKTLALFQELAKEGEAQTDGSVLVIGLPSAHGNHFHIGDGVAFRGDTTGLFNEVVYTALERKGMILSRFPMGALVTVDGLEYETGMRDLILFDDAD